MRVRCDATLVSENDETGYYLVGKLIGYDADGDVVTTYTNGAAGDSSGIAAIPPGG